MTLMQESSAISKDHTSNISEIIYDLAENQNIGYQITDLKGNILEINSKGAHAFGLRENFLESVNFFDLFSTANKEIIRSIYHDLVSANHTEEKLLITPKSKEVQTFQIHFYLIKMPLKKDYHVLGVYNPIDNLSPDQNKCAYEQIIKISNDAIIQLNSEWELEDINNKGLEFTGYAKSELLGTRLIHLIDPQYVKKACDFYQIQRQEKISTTEFEFPIQQKNGNQRWVRQMINAQFNDEGEIIGYLGLANDITEMIYLKKQLSVIDHVLEKRVNWRTKELGKINNKLRNEIELRSQTEEALRASEQEYKSLFQNANDAIIIIDVQTEEILEINDIACDIYGFCKDAFLKKSFKDTLGSKAGLERNLIFQTLNQKKYYVGEIIINVHGKEITLDVHANEVVYKGRKAILSVNRDITLKKEIQKELLDEKNRGLSALIDGQEMERRRLSREMHDGLGQLLTTSQIYLKQLKKNINSESLETVDKIQEIIDITMQEVRSISHNLMPSVLDDFGLSIALKHMMNNLINSSETNIELYVEDGLGRMDPEIEVGLYRLAQEALNNALKYAKGAKIEISLKEKKEGLELTIKDNGNGFGIDSNYMKNEGDGLSNMAQRASSIGCDFKIKSQKGKGTLIWVHYNLKHE